MLNMVPASIDLNIDIAVRETDKAINVQLLVMGQQKLLSHSPFCVAFIWISVALNIKCFSFGHADLRLGLKRTGNYRVNPLLHMLFLDHDIIFYF